MTTPSVPQPPISPDLTGQTGQDAVEPQPLKQVDIDKIVEDRLAKERRKYADYGDLKAKAAKFDEIEAQNATELEKAVKKAAEDTRAEMSSTTNQRLVRAEVRAAAAALGFHDPTDAAAQLRDRLQGVKVTDDGEVDESAVKALIEELAKAKPYLVKTDNVKPPPLPGQGHTQAAPSSGRDAGLAEAERRFGKPAQRAQT